MNTNTRPESRAKPAGALQGIRILDLTTVVLGPLATRILGDHGADVIKIEAPVGDITRANGTVRSRGGLSSNFLAMNRNKRSIAIDLKSPDGLEIMRRLIRGADVLVHNVRVAAIERLGLGYEAVKALNPRLVYCAATGYGQDGPYRDKPAFDDIMQAAGGAVGLVAQKYGEPDFMPTLLADKTAAMAVANAVLAAIVHRERTGRGQYVEVPMFESFVDFMLAEHMGGMSFEPQEAPAGYRRLTGAGRRLLPTQDGHVVALPYTIEQWRAFFDAVGRPDVLSMLGVRGRAEVNAKAGELYGEVAKITPSRTTRQWLELFERLDIAATEPYSLDGVREHPHLREVGLFRVEEHPTQGTIRTLRPTARFTDSPMQINRLAPELGQHSAELLEELGFAADEVAAMIARRTVVRTDVDPKAGVQPKERAR